MPRRGESLIRYNGLTLTIVRFSGLRFTAAKLMLLQLVTQNFENGCALDDPL